MSAIDLAANAKADLPADSRLDTFLHLAGRIKTNDAVRGTLPQ